MNPSNHTAEESFYVAPLGTLRLNKDQEGFYWFGRITGIVPEVKVELTIRVTSDAYPSHEQLELVKQFISEVDYIVNTLLVYFQMVLEKKAPAPSVEQLKQMYYLTAVELKADNRHWWLTLEPMPDVETIWNFFPRFTLRDREIVWSNLE